jgi:hypothetical protein
MTSTTKTATTRDNAVGYKHSQAMLREATKHALDWLEESFSISQQPTGLVEELSDALSYAEQHGINAEHDAGLRDDACPSCGYGLEDGKCPSVDCAQSDTGQSSRGAKEWQISGYTKSHRADGQRVVRITAPHPDGGGQDIAEVLESIAPMIIARVNAHESLIAVLEDELAALQVWQKADLNDLDDLFAGFAISIDKLSKALKQARGGE